MKQKKGTQLTDPVIILILATALLGAISYAVWKVITTAAR